MDGPDTVAPVQSLAFLFLSLNRIIHFYDRYQAAFCSRNYLVVDSGPSMWPPAVHMEAGGLAAIKINNCLPLFKHFPLC